ncbi:MAG: ATP-binding cassette domain-containing protein [Anaerolineales bacterium]|nr:ATP-binding cassette domain-containing protein [Anaerolineales bacterium]
MLTVQNLRKKYGDHEVVKGINFSVEEGEVFGLLGPNGAGKTQTISMLTGVIEPTEGTAVIGGYDIKTQMNEVKKINGLVPQDLALYPTLSARANLNFFGRIYGLHGKELKERVEDVLHIVSLTDRADEAVEKYSGGMKRRVNIAAGLVHHPRLFFLDEPTVGVDPQSRNHIFESVQRLNRERGMSIVYTSHYMEEVELLCNRVAIIDEGRIIAMDTIKNLIAMLGGGIIQIGLPAANQKLLNELTALPAVQDACVDTPPARPTGETEPEEAEVVTREGVVVKIMTKNTQHAIVNVIDYLNEKDLNLLSLNILEPNLETVFLHLTGKKLRE